MSTTAPAAARLTATWLGDLGVVPFDADTEDAKPSGNAWWYGRDPDIIARVVDGGLMVLVHDDGQPTGGHPRDVLVELQDNGGGDIAFRRAFDLPVLSRPLGFRDASDGGSYYVTGLKQTVTATDPPGQGLVPGVVHLYRLAANGQFVFDLDLNVALEAYSSKSAAYINPGVASTGRLELAGDWLEFITGINLPATSTGVRHQKSLSTSFNATTGAIMAADGQWVSHSFDQRLLPWNGAIYDAQLGDAFPRAITLGVERLQETDAGVEKAAKGQSASVYFPAGAEGANNTSTDLGNLVPITSGAHSGEFLINFAGDPGVATPDGGQPAPGSFELGLIRLMTDGSGSISVDTGLGQTWTSESEGVAKANRALLLTDYQHASPPNVTYVRRPKLIAIGGDRFISLHEEFAQGKTFTGTYAMLLDSDGKVLAGPKLVSHSQMDRDDDAVAFRDGAAWVSGVTSPPALIVHVVAPDLSTQEITVQ
jgi:hypothetical protein